MSTEPTETTEEICLRNYLGKAVLWSVLAAAFLVICVGLPVTIWIH